MCDFTTSLILEYRIGEFKKLHACLAALSAASLPLIPICAGTQQNKIRNPLLQSSS